MMFVQAKSGTEEAYRAFDITGYAAGFLHSQLV